MSKLFEMLCTMLGVKHLTTSAYQPQGNDQAELYNCTIVKALRQYIVKKLERLGQICESLPYTYSTQKSKLANLIAFNLVILRHPPRQTIVSQLRSLTTSSYVEKDPRLLRLGLQQ